MEYIGTKLIEARPMTRAEYNTYRGWDLPTNENGDDEGYLVEYRDGGERNHAQHAGYISWSPKTVFERSYRPVTRMTFGDAMHMLKTGAAPRVAREGWNGKGMFIYLNEGSVDRRNPTGTHIDGVSEHLFHSGDRGTGTRLPNINMRSASGATVTGWLASQADMLADDWTVV